MPRPAGGDAGFRPGTVPDPGAQTAAIRADVKQKGKGMAEDLTAWIGRSQRARDHITDRLQSSFAALLEGHLAMTEAAAPGLFWCLAPTIALTSTLGPDGHAASGFLPPVPLPRRMWAGGEVAFLAPLAIGDAVEKLSTIQEITWKTGRSGRLCFVILNHDYRTPRGLAIRERQDLVFRPAATGPTPAPAPANPAPQFDLEWRVKIDPVLLFRFSALTFNSHRIHYDLPYATDTEFYDGLVIHGPLQATLLLNAAVVLKGALPRKFRYSGNSPATAPQILRIGAGRVGDTVQMSAVTAKGVATMTAEAVW